MRHWLSPWPWPPRLAGEDLQPFLNVHLDCGQPEWTCESFVAPLIVARPASAEVNVNGPNPGTYDSMLLDESRELAAPCWTYAAPVAIDPPSRIRT